MPKLITPTKDRTNTFTDLHLMKYDDVFIATLNDRFGRLAGAIDSLRNELDFSVGKTSLNGVGQVYSGTHAQRLATTGAGAGLVVVETDRTVAYVNGYFAGGVMASTGNKPTDLGTRDKGFEYWDTDQTTLYRWNGSRWDYQMGTWQGILADIPATADLGPGDEGLLYYAIDFGHTYRFDGTDWKFAPGDPGSGWVGFFIEVPNNDGLWALCDGSVVDRALPDGTTASITLPQLSGGAYVKGASSYSGGLNDAIPPEFSGHVIESTDPTGAGTAHTHSHSMGGPDNTDVVSTGGVSTIPVAGQAHVHSLTIGNESTHTHPNTHVHEIAMTADAGLTGMVVDVIGEPANVEFLPYMRL